MEGFVPYLGWAVLTVVVVLIVMHLKKKGVEAAHKNYQPLCREDKRGEKYRGFKIFLSSPGGLDEFRDAFCDEVNSFNKNHAEGRNVIFLVKKSDDIPTDRLRAYSHTFADFGLGVVMVRKKHS